MAVYVDPLMTCIPNSRWRYTKACHMYADTLMELHAFAKKIGMKPSWFQDKRLPHYDLTQQRREAAVKMGAIQTSHKHMVEFMRNWQLLKKAHEECLRQESSDS